MYLLFIAAAGIEDGLGELYCPPSDLSAFSSMVRVCGSQNWERRPIPVMTLDTIWHKYLKKKEAAYLKIDVEGFEKDVIQGGNNMLRSNVPPVIQFEVNGQVYKDHGVDGTEVADILKSSGFRVARLSTNNKHAISEYVESEQQVASENLFAVPPGCIQRFDMTARRALNRP